MNRRLSTELNDKDKTNCDQLTKLCDEAIQFAAELIQIDTSNYGNDQDAGELAAAQYIQRRLAEVGLETEIIYSANQRANIVFRIPGKNKDALLIHGHLDVVPAAAKDWSVDPFGGVIRDGYLWGRGAVDMKNMVGMMLAIARKLILEKTVLSRELCFAFVSDEEAGGRNGMKWLVDNRPELFAGCTQAISEVGGYCITLPTDDGPRRAYLVQTAEKGYLWGSLQAAGRAGHGSIPNDDNAISHLAKAIVNIEANQWPRESNPALEQLIAGVEKITGRTFRQPEEFLSLLGGARGFIEATFRDSVNVTALDAGNVGNVVPSTAAARFDCRFLPGRETAVRSDLQTLVGDKVSVEIDNIGPSIQAPFEVELVEQMAQAIKREDPDAYLLPYCLSAGTDNKWVSQLGIDGYGFVPLQLPAQYQFAQMFHGVDERVPLEAIKFGTRVLWNLLAN